MFYQIPRNQGIMKKPIIHHSFFLIVASILMIYLLCSFDGQAMVTYSAPLKGKELQMGNMLKWSTVVEVNSQLFVVEKSIDGINYESIGHTSAKGNTNNETEYRFLDIGVNDPEAYYRLKQLDEDGTGSYSQTIKITKALTNNFQIVAMSHTLTDKLFEITYDALVEGKLEYIVETYKGEKVFADNQEVINGLNDIRIDLEDEKAGIYKVHLILRDERETLIIQKVDDEIKRKENVASKKVQNGG